MADDVRRGATTAVTQRRSARCYAMPASVLLLGILSIAMLLWTSALNNRQLANFALVDALEGLQTRTATAHLWLEEALVERQPADFDAARSDMAEAKKLSEVILQGGQTEHHLLLRLSQDRNLSEEIGKVRGLLDKFETIAAERYAHPETSGIGSELDRRFDDVFRDIQGRVGALEGAAEKTLKSDYLKMERLFLGVIFAWSLIIVAATTGLWNREVRRKRAEEALQDAKDELEVKVAERTQELGATNEQLSLELAQRKKAEAEKAILQKEAERAAHLAALGELAAGTAHEINNPVNGIINCAEILVNKTAAGSREQDLGRRIIKDGDRIAFIVQSLLSFAREEGEEKVSVQVRDILTDTLALTEARLRKEGITLLMDIDGDGLAVCAQPQHLEQVFLNIINNARDALNQKYPEKEEGKTLTITAKRAFANGRPQVRIAFHDQGTGIPEQVMNRVMNPFFSTKPKGKGTGLGLSISQGIVANCGGKLTIDSVEGAFTEVAVELPLLEEAG